MKHFTEIELGMKNVSSEIKENMYALVNNILDPLREKVGVIIVSSGYRSESYNKQIGGAKNPPLSSKINWSNVKFFFTYSNALFIS